MRDTTFHFEIRVHAEDSECLLEELRDKMRSVKGVTSVSVNSASKGIADVNVLIFFANAEEAKKLHRKIMNLLISLEGITLSQVTTMLTDIFE